MDVIILPMPSAVSTPTVCLHPIAVIHHFHRPHPFPVQAKHLSFSFMCDLYSFLLYFFKLFSISSSKCAVEECDIYLLLTQPLPC
jgi:hypothetical protein